MKNFSINGFGRIGRTFLRVWWEKGRENSSLKVINTSGSMEIDQWAHLLKYDTNYGVFSSDIKVNKVQSVKDATDENPVLGTITLGREHEITVTAQKDPKKIPWKKYEIEVVVDATGIFITEEKASGHLESGAQKVLLTAPAKGGNVSTSIIGVNKADQNAKIFSNASCTTNCVAPVAKIMSDVFGVEKAMLTTIHSYTDDQNTQDNSHKDLRRARSAAENIIPTTTGAAKATTEIIPELAGIFDGIAIRVPTPTGSLSDMVFVTKRDVTKEEINQAFIDASKEERWKGILAVTNDPIVSSDIIGRSESSIVDLDLTNVVGGNLVKVISWYDNEWGYCNRLVEQLEKL
ncbi:MAG: type I glyceraldehyde-3-phosphate dehydrogenase [Candidatus Pacebacteria bacterium CG1_02_43_31]|nr:type I glyceraldehyde-3-phosphate dehydrogenase [Candidatus Paceibacterota bacterium]NCS86882.1 type I glyceraldehyde-3-phosphate dehydrogenase [Candidatus Paceibacterota bacterium]OIO45370.1 MAG: type I glyceraldehyde-3-phosphate dehydrogenase [Candidatus Pacebacteria bacterium CG1_02_43_31]PIQ80634.1 MAG: type I glyceraldehyde-3-phosphate dehydrogenase [Candidatus Pacebacteria bacterium CG11_big_fil_rev_8_21_14_0_20_34_55]PJC43985.1 MAG: type I glyceraldehyde-3-phosphate dehydrogenase [Can